jgi:competence protein ComEA
VAELAARLPASGASSAGGGYDAALVVGPATQTGPASGAGADTEDAAGGPGDAAGGPDVLAGGELDHAEGGELHDPAADRLPDASDTALTNAAPAGTGDVPGAGPVGTWIPEPRAPGAPRGRAWAERLTTGGPWGDLAEKWVPEPLRGARIDPKRRGAVLLTAVAAIAAIAAALGVWWSRPQPTPVPAASGAVSAAAATSLGTALSDEATGDGDTHGGAPAVAAPAAPGATGRDATGSHSGEVEPAATSGLPAPAASSGTIVVSVTGHVRHPGVVTVPARARVADAITAAGGALDDSDLTGLNLAALLTDGSSIVVLGSGGGAVTVGSTSAAGTGGGDTAKISLNTADAAALQTLSGVGPVTAAAIIAYRTEHGPFTELAQLQEVSGIGPATFARLEPHVTL